MENCELSQMTWRKARRSGMTNCVEVATTRTVVGIRDTKDRQGPVLLLPSSRWTSFLAGMKDGEFDHPRT